VYVLELGGQDDRFARREAASACTAVTPLGTGLATARGVTDRVRGLAFTRRAAALVGRTAPRIEDAVTLLDAAALDGVPAGPAGRRTPPEDREEGGEREGSIRVRARDIRGLTGVDTERAERELGQVLVDRGFDVDLEEPDHELRALFAAPPGHGDDDDGTATIGIDDTRDVEVVEHAGEADAADLEGLGEDDPGVCALGWLTAESQRDFGDRQPTDKPFFQPGSMDPLLARALANIAGARPGRALLDPMCGTGGLLAEAALVGADVVGVDAQWKMVRGARQNLGHYLTERDDGGDTDETAHEAVTGAAAEPGDFAVCRGDARRLPVAGVDGTSRVDTVVFDAPYGRQSWASAELAAVVGDALAEARRVARHAVVVGDRSWAEAAETAGWTVEDQFERRVHGSLVRHILVLSAGDEPTG
jgi:tRNA (guanine10-N2)-dimethyltransferase